MKLSKAAILLARNKASLAQRRKREEVFLVWFAGIALIMVMLADAYIDGL